MAKRFLSIEELNELLRQWNGKKVKVVKHEMDDLDQTFINLNRISYAKEYRSIDDYEPRYALHLNGSGLIETTENNYEELPSDLFEIPLDDDALYEFDGTRFIFSTARGVYTLELIEE